MWYTEIMSCEPTCKCQCSPKRKLYCCGVCGAVSCVLTISFALALALNLTDELFFLIIKKVANQLANSMHMVVNSMHMVVKCL